MIDQRYMVLRCFRLQDRRPSFCPSDPQVGSQILVRPAVRPTFKQDLRNRNQGFPRGTKVGYQYLLHKYLLMGQKVTFCHHHMTHQQKLLNLKAILRHTTTHPFRYQTQQMTRIWIHVHQIILCRIHLTHDSLSNTKE